MLYSLDTVVGVQLQDIGSNTAECSKVRPDWNLRKVMTTRLRHKILPVSGDRDMSASVRMKMTDQSWKWVQLVLQFCLLLSGQPRRSFGLDIASDATPFLVLRRFFYNEIPERQNSPWEQMPHDRDLIAVETSIPQHNSAVLVQGEGQ